MTEALKVVGGRRLVVHDDEVEIGAHGNWRLVECPAYSKDGWKSLKLYLDEIAPKNVWRIGVRKGKMSRCYDAGLLMAHSPSLADWICAVAEGKLATFPEDPNDGDGVFPVPLHIRSFILNVVRDAQATDRPWSNAPQTRTRGRFLPTLIVSEFGMKVDRAKIYVRAMIKEGLIRVIVLDKKKHRSGLVVCEGEHENG
jgi:hypothetical protein